jgi:hypothetical protein
VALLNDLHEMETHPNNVIEGGIDQHPEWPERLAPVVIEIRNGPTSEPPGKGAKSAPPPKPATLTHNPPSQV